MRIYILHKMHGGRRPQREGLGSAGGYRQHTTMSNTNCHPLQNLASIAQNGRAFEDQPSRRRRPQPSRGIATVLSGEQPQWLVGVKGGAKRGAGKEGVCGKHAPKAPRAWRSCTSEAPAVMAAAPEARSDAACEALLATLMTVREAAISGSVSGFSRKERSLKSMPPVVKPASATLEGSFLGRSCEKRLISMKWVRGHTNGICEGRALRGGKGGLNKGLSRGFCPGGSKMVC